MKAIIERVQTRFETYDAAGTSDFYWCVDHVGYESGVPGVTTVGVSICRRLVGRDDSRRFPVCWYETMRVRLIQYGTEWLKPVLVAGAQGERAVNRGRRRGANQPGGPQASADRAANRRESALTAPKEAEYIAEQFADMDEEMREVAYDAMEVIARALGPELEEELVGQSA